MTKTRTYKSRDGGYTTEVTIVRQEQYDDGPFSFDGTLEELAQFVADVTAVIPDGCMETAVYDISSCTFFGNSSAPFIEISYKRPATEDEIAAWETIQQNRANLERQRELAQLQALKAKYGA